jgi:hypothetical protein
MHQYFAIDKVSQDTRFQPVEELIGRPEFVRERSGRWHENSIERINYVPKTSGFNPQTISDSAVAKGERTVLSSQRKRIALYGNMPPTPTRFCPSPTRFFLPSRLTL